MICSGENHYNWKGGKYITKDGYVMIHVGKSKSSNGYIAEHILVMEKYIGRKLLPHEMVHHIEEGFKARSKNVISNLKLTNRVWHRSHHMIGNTYCKGKGKGYSIYVYKGRWKLQMYLYRNDKRYIYSGTFSTKEKAEAEAKIKIMKRIT